MFLSEDQIISLAPDASSLKSGKDLAVKSKWQLRGVSENALWGHCQGSGKLPYQTQVDLKNFAFKCSCPSRKFPCKHGLGLLILYSREPGSFSTDQEPGWVSDWLNKRTEKASKKTETEKKPVDSESQAKRAEARAKKVSDGIEDLQIWIKDLIRNGLITLPERSYDYWQNPAKRMIDAQATGLAGMIKALGNINYFTESWKHEVLKQIVKIYLVTESYKHIESLPEDFQHEVRSLIGFTQNKEEILTRQGIQDTWIVLARTVEDDEQINIEKNWLYGVNSKKIALILQFFAIRQLPELNFLPGTFIDAELVFYPGVFPFRALIKKQEKVEKAVIPECHSTISKVFEEYNNIVGENPFFDHVPLLFENVCFIKNNNEYFFMDEEGSACKVNTSEGTVIKILAITGGKPCKVFALVNEDEAEPLAVWVNNHFFTLTNAIQK